MRLEIETVIPNAWLTRLLMSSLCAGALVLGGACSDDELEVSPPTDPAAPSDPAAPVDPTDPTDPTDPEPEEKDIVDIASETAGLETLVALVSKLDLVDTLKGEGPFTVLAPNNDAFDALFEELGVDLGETSAIDYIDGLDEDEDEDEETLEQLRSAVMYHVIGESVLAGDIEDEDTIATLLLDEVEEPVTLTAKVTTSDVDETITVSFIAVGTNEGDPIEATVLAADVEASNGVVHIIDTVLLPFDLVAEDPSSVELLRPFNPRPLSAR